MLDLQAILAPYNPWWKENTEGFKNLPEFRRPIFYQLYDELKTVPQILSITGPRRIGKSTLLYHLLQKLLSDSVPAQHLIYYSFDDPALIARRIKVDELIDRVMKLALKQKDAGPTYLFLDEIQRLERWELYLKKYYDLKYPIKIVISGSASSPIFKKSRESLLGRVKDFHLLPFSFREYVLYSLQQNHTLLNEVTAIYELGKTTQGMFAEDPAVQAETVTIPGPSKTLCTTLDALLQNYFLEGGFPEVWTLPTWIAKQEVFHSPVGRHCVEPNQ